MLEEGKGLTTAAKRIWNGDGCTGVPNFWWLDCCDEHDKDYAEGKHPKKELDAKFYACLKAKAKTPLGRYFFAPLYYAGVRLFGGRAWRKHRRRQNG